VDSSDPTSRMHQLGDADLVCSEASQLHPRYKCVRPQSAPGMQRKSNERSHTFPLDQVNQ